MKSIGLLILVGMLSLHAAESRAARSETAASHVVKSDSKIFTLDRIYKSMFGPDDTDRLTLLPTSEPEVLWITAIGAEVVGPDGETPESAEYFCHTTFIRRDRQPDRRLKQLKLSVQFPKMFTMVQGLREIRFPEGFGMPVFSNDQFDNIVMVMNPTEPEEPVRVGVDSRIEYVRESELDYKMKPLFVVAVPLKVLLEGADVDHSGHEHEGEEACLSPDPQFPDAQSVDRASHGKKSPIVVTASGEKRTGHWYVPPGRHTYRHHLGPLTNRIPFDTKAHYIAAHLHPFGESLELIDLTTGKSVFKATARNFPNRVALEEITHFSSREGLTIDRSHDHEMVAIYNNTTDQDVDSMAVMYLYLHDSLGAKLARRRR